jgi:hypothetical protein
MNKAIKGNVKNMEEARWKKDETSYFLFTCEKCGRWLYVKTTQKNKKCLNCRRTHVVNSIKKRAEIVKGITPAARRVKELQHDLAREERGRLPDLRSENDFNPVIMTSNQHSINRNFSKQCNSAIDKSTVFYRALLEVKFQSFPFYIIEMIAEELEIPKSELKILMRELIKGKVLIPLPNQYFKVSNNSKRE